MKFIRKNFSKYLFQTALQREQQQKASKNEMLKHWELLSQSTLFIAFYHQKASKNEMLQQFGVSTTEIYQEGFLKVSVLNTSTKGAMVSSFRRGPCL